MKRREFLRKAAAVGATGAAALTLGACAAPGTPGAANASPQTASGASPQAAGGQAPAQGSDLPQLRWRMATSWPKSLDTIFGGAQTVADRVREMTDGRFVIEPFAAGEIVPGLQVLDAVQAGTVECGHTAAYYYVGKSNAFAFATSLPFGLTAQQQNAWLYHGGGMEALKPLYDQFGVVAFPAGNTGAQMGGWYKREVNSVSDLQGLKFRIPGLGGQVLQRLGALPQTLPGGEIFLALDRGAIDAAEWVGPYDDEVLGLQNAAPFYYYPGWWEPGPALEVQINRAAWDRLPKVYQEIIRTACYEANVNMLAKYDALNGAALQRLVEGGTQLKAYSDEILQAAQTAAFELYEEFAANDQTFRTIYEGWRAFREQIYRWNRTNEFSFVNFEYARLES